MPILAQNCGQKLYLFEAAFALFNELIVNFFNKLSRIDPCEKRVNILGGQHWRNFFMACSKFVTMTTYVVKQA